MKKFLGFITLTAALLLPLSLSAQTYTTQSGVSFFTSTSVTATATSGAIQLPTASGVGILNITESGITGSPSGCTIALKYRQNNATANTATVATVSFTPSTGTQQLAVNPTVPAGDSYVAVYACSSAYPTAGLISVSFSPIDVSAILNVIGSGDPCKNPSAATSSVAVSGVTTLAQQVALSAGKQIYVCQFTASVGTAGTMQLEYGTGTNCGTGTTALTGTINLAANTPFSVGWGGAVATAPAGNALCVVATQAAAGVISYVQQ